MARQSVFDMNFSKVYSLLIAKAERKCRSKEEVDQVTSWLTGYSVEEINQALGNEDLTYGDFFRNMPCMNPKADLIKGSICGVKIEEIDDPLMKKIRYLDKLVDELARGKTMEKVLRVEPQAKAKKESKAHARVKADSTSASSLWKCPSCGREFKKVNQSHYCGEKPKTIEEYIMSQDEEKRADLYTMQRILKEALPEAEERISWSMPTFWKKHNILHFAASKKHIGLYPGPAAVEAFQDKLKDYKTDKGTIRIPYGKIDEELVRSIAQWCFATGNHA